MTIDGRTHWETCWREHLDCAVAKIEHLQAFIKTTAETLKDVEPEYWGDGCGCCGTMNLDDSEEWKKFDLTFGHLVDLSGE